MAGSGPRPAVVGKAIHSSSQYQAIMQDLIARLMAEGLTEQQAYKAIEIIKNFTKEKFPLFSGPIDKLFDKYAPKTEDDFMP